jgi:hypothetical protein
MVCARCELFHKPRMVLMDSPYKVVDAIVKATINPQAEVPVGYKAKTVVGAHRLARRLTENLAERVTYHSLMQSPPAEPTVGSLYAPMPAGTGVNGGLRDRTLDENGKR